MSIVSGAEYMSNMVLASSEFSDNWKKYSIFDTILAGLRSQGQGTIREFGLENIIDENDMEHQDIGNLENFKNLICDFVKLGFR